MTREDSDSGKEAAKETVMGGGREDGVMGEGGRGDNGQVKVRRVGVMGRQSNIGDI